MRALRFERTGSLDYLAISDVPVPTPAGGELLVKVEAAALNPSDAKNVLGLMHETKVPRTPGRDFAGRIVGGPPSMMGQWVFGTGGDLGFGRDGSHAEYLVVPSAAVVPIPKGLSFVQAAAIGLPYLTASAAVGFSAKLLAGETILITGTGGAVGSAASRIAHRLGARVIGVVRRKQDLPKLAALPVADWIDLETAELGAACKTLTSGKGADVVFDTVGGPLFEPCLGALAKRGRQVAIASGGMPRVTFNVVNFYHNESRLVGLDSLKWGFQEAAEILRAVVPAFESGEYPPPEVLPVPLRNGIEYYRQIDAGRLKSKVVLTP